MASSFRNNVGQAILEGIRVNTTFKSPRYQTPQELADTSQNQQMIAFAVQQGFITREQLREAISDALKCAGFDVYWALKRGEACPDPMARAALHYAIHNGCVPREVLQLLPRAMQNPPYEMQRHKSGPEGFVDALTKEFFSWRPNPTDLF